MAETTTKYRDYDMDDAELFSRARTIRAHFLKYLTNFAGFDPDFNTTFSDNWLALIEDCELHDTDETTRDGLGQYTADLEAAKTKGFLAANDLEYYVNKAFPNNPRKIKEFGLNKRSGLRARTLNLIIWLFVMKKVADDYTAELTAKGMAPAVLTNLENAAKDIADREIAQEYFKRIRLRLTTQRMEKFNSLYAICKQVESAAESVFFDSEEHKGLFVI